MAIPQFKAWCISSQGEEAPFGDFLIVVSAVAMIGYFPLF